MKKKLISAFLCMAMLTGMLTGCGEVQSKKQEKQRLPQERCRQMRAHRQPNRGTKKQF